MPPAATSPLLTILIPTYNRSRFLGLLLERFRQIGIAGTLAEGKVELVVSDNHSTDATADLIAEYQEKIPGLRCIMPQVHCDCTEMHVPSVLDQCRGTYVWTLCDDDVPEADAVPWLCDLIERERASLFVLNPSLVSQSGRLVDEHLVPMPEQLWRGRFSDVVIMCGMMNLCAGFSLLIFDRKTVMEANWSYYREASIAYTHVATFLDCFRTSETILVSRPLIRYFLNETNADSNFRFARSRGKNPRFLWGIGILRLIRALEYAGAVDTRFVFQVSEYNPGCRRVSTFLNAVFVIGAQIREWVKSGDPNERVTVEELEILAQFCHRRSSQHYGWFELYDRVLRKFDALQRHHGGMPGLAAAPGEATREQLIGYIDQMLGSLDRLTHVRSFEVIDTVGSYRIVEWADSFMAVHRSVGTLDLAQFGCREIKDFVLFDTDHDDLHRRVRMIEAAGGPWAGDTATPAASYRVISHKDRWLAAAPSVRSNLEGVTGRNDIGQAVFVGRDRQEVETCLLSLRLRQSPPRAIPTADGGDFERAIRSIAYLFDAIPYEQRLVAAGGNQDDDTLMHDPVGHYLRKGHGMGLPFSPLFREDWYLDCHPDARREVETGRWLSGLHHFAAVGQFSGHAPHPLMDYAWLAAAAENAGIQVTRLLEKHPGLSLWRLYFGGAILQTLVANRFFDPGWYAVAYGAALPAEVRSTPRDLFRHYVTKGAAQGLCPNGVFDESAYRINNPDIMPLFDNGQLQSGFEHWLLAGRREGRATVMQAA